MIMWVITKRNKKTGRVIIGQTQYETRMEAERKMCTMLANQNESLQVHTLAESLGVDQC